MTEETPRKTLCIFEDTRYPNFFPLTLNKPVFDLFIGTQTLRSRIVSEFNPDNLWLQCRCYLVEVLVEQESSAETSFSTHVNQSGLEGEVIFINGRLLAFESTFQDLLSGLSDGCVLHKGGVVVAARLSGDTASSFLEYLSTPLSDENMTKVVNEIKRISSGSEEIEGGGEELEIGRGDMEQALQTWAEANGVVLEHTETALLSYYWQLIGENKRCIVDDFQKNPFRGTSPETELFKGVDLINEEDIVIGSEAEIRSGTVLDASEGPIIISDRVRIEPNAIINGPCFIGAGSIIRGGAKIGGGTSIGNACRIGGEVEETIIAPYSNKQHEGFVGHSYIGSWVNIGAGSCNSDLKNNYMKVKAWCSGALKETGRRFLGVVVGDHAKIAINSRINTGTVIGFNSNVLTSGFPPKFVPSFSWSLEPEFEEYDLKSALETAEIMMDRRNEDFSPAMEELFKVIMRFCRQSGHSV